MSVADEEAKRRAREAERAEKQQIADARKKKMLELAEHAKKDQKLSELEKEKLFRKQKIREAADKKVDENLDLVKMLNTLGARAAAFTIRDKQLSDKGDRAESDKEY